MSGWSCPQQVSLPSWETGPLHLPPETRGTRARQGGIDLVQGQGGAGRSSVVTQSSQAQNILVLAVSEHHKAHDNN